MTSPSFSLPAPEPEKEPTTVDSIRGQLRSAFQNAGTAEQRDELDKLLATAIQIIRDGTEATRKWKVLGFRCEKCQHTCPHYNWVEITDPKGAREALGWVMEQLEGRPGVAGVDNQGIIVRYEIVAPND